jgi:hypothetical protein
VSPGKHGYHGGKSLLTRGRAVATYRLGVRRVLVVLGVVTIAAGVTATGGLSIDRDDAPAPTPSVARLTCGPEGTAAADARVLASRDGVHVRVTNLSRDGLVEVRSATDELLAESPIQLEGVTDAVLTVPPGPVTVTCLAGREDDRARASAVLEIVAREERWLAPDPTCAPLERTESSTREIAGEGAIETARRAIDGLLPGDELRTPGYPDSTWHGDLLVVVRDGRTIGRITRAQNRGAWSVVVAACPGTGLAAR